MPLHDKTKELLRRVYGKSQHRPKLVPSGPISIPPPGCNKPRDDNELIESIFLSDRLCIPCAGTGKSSKGQECYPCCGTGKEGERNRRAKVV